MNPLLLGIFGYIVLQLLIGFAVSRGIRTESDYLVAGRTLGYPLATFSIFATWFGAETCIGASGKVHAEGLSGTSADPFGYGLCLFFMAAVFATPLWKRKLNTLADLFSQRFSSGVAQAAAVLMIPTSVLWAGGQLRAFGHVLSTASDALSLDGWILVAAGVTLTYTVVGGLLADAYTDMIQGILLLIGLVVLLFAVSGRAGGFAASFESIDPELLRMRPEGQDWTSLLNTWAVPIIGSVTAQELISRVSGARSATVARRSGFIAATIYVIFGLIPVFLGLVGGPLVHGKIDDSDAFLPALAREQFHEVGYVLFVGVLISAILSTVDSALLVAGSLFSHNLVLPRLKSPSERTKLLLARAGVVLCGIAAFWLALSTGSVVELVEDASGFGSAGIFVIVVFGLFGRFGGRWSALAALLAGIAVWIEAHYVSEREGDYLLSLGAAILAYVVVALVESRGVRSAPRPALAP